MYTFLIDEKFRNNLLYYLKSKKIEASAHFDPPLHKQNYLKKFSNKGLKNTNLLAKKIISLPMYPDLTSAQITKIMKTISQWYKKNVI